MTTKIETVTKKVIQLTLDEKEFALIRHALGNTAECSYASEISAGANTLFNQVDRFFVEMNLPYSWR
jgi:hypothetical protein